MDEDVEFLRVVEVDKEMNLWWMEASFDFPAQSRSSVFFATKFISL
jgi:hypothetical protein